MARIVGVDIPRNKKVSYSLRYIHGNGLTTAQKLCVEAKVDPDTRVQDLTEEQVVALRDAISSLGFIVEGELRSQTAMNIKRLKDVGTYRGLRHRRGLPSNGQRTKTNARTRKGKKRTIGLGKKYSLRKRESILAENKPKKKKKKSAEPHGIAHIKSTFNNTHVTLTDMHGNVLFGKKLVLPGLKDHEKVQLMPQQWQRIKQL